MTKAETAHAVFTVALFCLVFRSAGDPLSLTAGLLIIALTDRLVVRHAPR